MKTRSFLIASSAVITAIAGGLYLTSLANVTPVGLANEQSPAAHVASEKTIIQEAVPMASTEVEMKQTDAQRSNVEAPPKFSHESVEAFKKEYRQIFLLGNNVDRETKRNDIYEQLSRNPEVMDLIKNTVGDYENSQRYFGDEQAQARVASIKILNYLAKQGNYEPLEYALSQTASRLKSSEWVKGVEHDYSDLVTGYIGAKMGNDGDNYIAANFDAIAQQAGASTAIYDPFRIGLELSLSRELSKENYLAISEKLKQLREQHN